MKEHDLVPGAFVYHSKLGAGQVTRIEGDGQWVVVNFHDKLGHRMTKELALRSLKTLPKDGLEANLLTNPESAYSWVKEAPLRLVAATVADLGGSCKPRDLRERLEARVLRNVKWQTWWKRVQPAIKASPYFQLGDGSIALKAEPNGVPLFPVPPPPRRARGEKSAPLKEKEWLEWLLGDREVALPAPMLPRIVLKLLKVLPASLLDRAGERLVAGFGAILRRAENQGRQRLEVWTDAISFLCERWVEKVPSASPEALAKNTTQLTVTLFDQSSRNDNVRNNAKRLAQALASLAQRDERALHGICLCVVDCLELMPDGVTKLLQTLKETLSAYVRLELWRSLAREVFQEGAVQQESAILRPVDKQERAQVYEYLALLGAQGLVSARKVVVALMRDWEEITEDARPALLRPIMMTVMLLGDASEPLWVSVEASFRKAIENETKMPSDRFTQKLVAIATKEKDLLQEKLEQVHGQQVGALAARLAEAEIALETARRSSADLQHELARAREQARLEVRRDMLLAIGETLKALSAKDRTPEELIEDAKAGLSLALYAGGAEVFGQVGQNVPYDPQLHDVGQPVYEGTPVVIVAPGVVVRSGQLGDVVLVKARALIKGA